MTPFDTFIMVDWSGGNDRGPRPVKDAIWACVASNGQIGEPIYLRNRGVAEAWINDTLDAALAEEQRVCIGFDFPFGYPIGFANAVTGQADPFALWRWLETRIEDSKNRNNRFDVAAEINARFDGRGPFWGNGLKRDIEGLPRNKLDYNNIFPDRRVVEEQAKGSFTCWQLAGAGAVGSQVLMGLPVLERLRRRFSGDIAVWPFEKWEAPIAIVEIWPSLFVVPPPDEMIKDAWQVQGVARALQALEPEVLANMLNVIAPEEGWIVGVGHEGMLQKDTVLAPPPLRNDCFALPAGVNWAPVDEALTLLQSRLFPVTPVETLPVKNALGRILANPVLAGRANPPLPNSAVDGYGFAGNVPAGAHRRPLIKGRAAAGVPFSGSVPEGSAVRVLTGAALPKGVDTVILEEDVTATKDIIAFNGPLKKGANARRAGEDIEAGDVLFDAGRMVLPADMALLSISGVSDVQVRSKLRVAVLSTGDELVEAGGAASNSQIYDANRPMLLSMIARFGYDSIDMGRVVDDRVALSDRLDMAADQADVILTSGGASAGDEDHVSALLEQAGAMALWRIALKPGRPLALGFWGGKPVFGLPGNPVAAMVCTLIFARPAMGLLAGEDWRDPQGFDVPADFEKSKKPGRREYLRARIRDGKVQVFASEGSGRISGLSWADGLVELEDGACVIKKGDMVRYIPYASFGI
ncbi:MAG: molybdopterin-binding protein [Paracoccaceae bacterium]